MAAVVRMPALAAGATEAAIQSWLVAVGDEVAAGQPIVEIETEKAVVEYEAEEAGVLARILVDEGGSAEVGSPIAVLAAQGEDVAVAGESASAAEPGDAAATTGATAGTESSEDGTLLPPAAVTELETPSAAEPPLNPGPPSSPGPPSNPGPPSDPAPTRRLFASPLVRRLAAERGLDLSSLVGTGPNGRIVRRDLDEQPPPAAQSPSTPAAPDVRAPAGPPIAARTQESPAADVEVIPHSGMRRAIARRLTESTSTVPHFFLRARIRVDELLALRARINEGRTTRISVNDFVIKAVAAALLDVPEANAIWTEQAMHRFSHADIAVAVSVPGGLVTPVIRGVDRMPLGEVSAAIADHVERARAGRLKQEELEGGSFSVSNLGMYGTEEFAAIINPPHSGILAVGAAQPSPVVVDGELVVGTVMTVTLSADHRVLDGALAAQWLAAFVAKMENPLSILV
ncbi:pyruvate dehydrogenase E2 component (dihydrolipoamide acetyltransferase) [Microbacterium sp. AK009]|uniref:dihydrolipoamide acetyltransferase family protein n=1 Tax=Microbacterium sp. AK009 TaxID=2723068 RepID=UPI0015C6DC7F|nr:dihydrolipoamide acetyltransferase family protein [Microbacterium sp. AK009]NYF17537.1 pyruvate dehydrogenase E2 component (dihydrolipoamide acetyltransferase) [Microbacterium sp. AK009]